jgi:SprB repeat/Secretion system C-terminal sorting domain
MYSMKFTSLLNQTSRHFAGVFMGLILSLVTFTQVSAQLTVSVTKTDPSCADFTNGSAVATAAGGVAPYTYKWSNGATGNTLTGVGAGTFNVTVTGANSATATASTTLSPATAIVTTFSFANQCAGGSVTANVSGGTGPYTINWGGGRVGATQSGLAAGGYNVIVTDSKGCTVYKFVNVPAPFTAGLRVGELVCFGDCDAAIDALPQGGVGPFTYRWNTGATTAAIIGIPSGTYSVTITDANGCTSNASGTVANPPTITVTTTTTAVNCAGSGSTGTATVSAIGGRPPFSYRWSNGQTGTTATGLSVGTYFVTVTDAKGCNKTAQATLTSSAGFTLTAASTNATCAGSNGSATATITGGSAPFTYKWSTGGTTATIGNLSAGNYTVTASDNSGCSATATTTVNAVGSLAITLTGTNAACGIANGTATATPTSGTAPFAYKWSTGATTQTIGTLAAGTYTVTVTDASGCTASGQKSITQTSSFDVTLDARNVSCNGGTNGQISAMVMGGSAPYTYKWSNGSTIGVLANLGANTYSVTVTDASGCTAIKSATISQPSALTTSVAPTMTTCSAANGSATVTAGGGTAPYRYAWTTGGTGASIANLGAGTYSVTVTDANGCTSVISTTITSSSSLDATSAVTNVKCNGSSTGSIALTVTGATGAVTYAWSTGATSASVSNLAAGTYSVTINDSRNCSVIKQISVSQPSALAVSASGMMPSCGASNGSSTATAAGGTAPYSYKWSTGATTGTISSLGGGAYSVTVTDANSCTASGSVTLTQSAPIVITPVVTSASCLPTGSVSVTVTGGSGSYTYLWSTGATTGTISSMAGGSYTVTVTDAAGCKNSATISIPSVTSPNFSCSVAQTKAIAYQGGNDGEATVTPANGRAPYTYKWSNGSTLAIAGTLKAGAYSVTVTDANGCTSTCSINIAEPNCAQLVNAGTISGNQNYCNTSELTGIFEATPGSGGTGAIEYLWMYSDFSADFSAGGWNTIVGATGKDLPANLLPTMVRKTNFIRCIRRTGCGLYIEGNIIMKVPAVAMSWTAERAPCLNRVNTFVAADNGTGATYLWTFQGANITTANTRSVNVTFTSLGAKTTTLTISNNGCTITRTFPTDVVNCFADYGNFFAFSASTTGNTNGVRLNWATTDEKKDSKFMIEKSVDNVNFTLIATVASQNLPNNLYSFNDPSPKQGRAFYRIHQMTPQGQDITMSKTEKVTLAAQGQSLVTYPNPAGANLFVEVVDTDNSQGTIEIYSEAGLLVKSQRFTANQVRYEVDTNDLGKGNYIMKVRKADGTTSTTKFSKF